MSNDNEQNKIVLELTLDEARQLHSSCLFRLKYDGKLQGAAHMTILDIRDRLHNKIDAHLAAATVQAMQNRCPSCEDE